MVVGHGEVESRGVAHILRIDLRAGFDQRLNCLIIGHAGGQLQRRQVAERDGPVLHYFESVAALGVDSGAVLDQQFDRCRVAIAVTRSGYQRREAAAIRGVHVGALCQQQTDQFDVVGGGRLLQNAHSALVAGIHAGAFFDQKPGRLDRAIVCGGDQQGRAPEFGACVDLGAL